MSLVLSPQAAGTAPGTTATSVGKTRRPFVSFAPTPSARLTRRGRYVPGHPQDSCAVRSTMSWRVLTTRPGISAQRQMWPMPLQVVSLVVRKAPRKRRQARPKQKAPRGKQQRPESSFSESQKTKPPSNLPIYDEMLSRSQEPRHCTPSSSGNAADFASICGSCFFSSNIFRLLFY